MKAFKTFNKISEASDPSRNTHLTHIEDLVIYGGVDGARQAITALRSLRNMLAGEASKSVDVSQKWDGAPAVFFGPDPRDGQFFVATKGIFNKDPKVYHTHAEIDATLSGDLAVKMHVALDELPKLGSTGIIQGDILFTTSTLKTQVIEGLRYVTFHPNTIVYAVPENSMEASALRTANLGVVLHTTYTGKSFETLKASYGVDVKKLHAVSSVWVQDAMLRDLSGTATMTEEETLEVTGALSTAGKIFQSIAGSTLKDIENNPEFAQLIEQFNNTFVRSGQKMVDPVKHAHVLVDWIHTKFAKEAEERKTEKGKASVNDKRDQILSFFSPVNSANIVHVFALQNAIVTAKEMLIRKLDRVGRISTFVKTTNGFRVTGSEGFVAIDRLSGGAVKLVNRMEFSTQNFDPSILKGWAR